jgi:hypothetical protein
MRKSELALLTASYASQGLRYVRNPNSEIAPSSGKDDVKRTAA